MLAPIMTRRAITGVAGIALMVAGFAAPVTGTPGQVSGLPAAPQRDLNPQPSVRRVPVGTAVITGVVTAADTGRPLKGVRVSVNGSTAPPGRIGGG